MSLVKILSIKNLQPTQEKVNLSIINHYSSGNYNSDLPEVWEIQNKLFIADGHHKTFSKYIKTLNKNLKIPVLFHSPKNLDVSAQAYEFLIDELLINAEKVKSKGIYHIKDLKLS